METFETHFHLNKRDGWKAITRIDLGSHKVLTISTYKPMAPAKGLRTQARVSTVEDGFERHVISFGPGGDFSKTLAHSLPARVTELVVREQHNRVLDTQLTTVGVNTLYAEITQHYEAQNQRKSGHVPSAHQGTQEPGHVV
jgi:hypothetical protein